MATPAPFDTRIDALLKETPKDLTPPNKFGVQHDGQGRGFVKGVPLNTSLVAPGYKAYNESSPRPEPTQADGGKSLIGYAADGVRESAGDIQEAAKNFLGPAPVRTASDTGGFDLERARLIGEVNNAERAPLKKAWDWLVTPDWRERNQAEKEKIEAAQSRLASYDSGVSGVATPQPVAPAPATQPNTPSQFSSESVFNPPAPVAPAIEAINRFQPATEGVIFDTPYLVTGPAPAQPAAAPQPAPAAAAAPLIRDPQTGPSGLFEGSYTDREGNTIGLLAGGGSRVMTPEEVVAFNEATKDNPSISGITGTGPAPAGMTKTIDPFTGQVVAADPVTAASFAQRESEIQKQDAEAYSRFLQSPEAGRMTERFVNQAREEQAVIDQRSAQRVGETDRRREAQAGGGGEDRYYGSQQYLRDLSGERGKDRQLKAMEAQDRFKTQDERQYREGLVQDDRQYKEGLISREMEVENRRKQEDRDFRMDLQKLENEGYAQSSVARANESIRVAMEKDRLETEKARNRLVEQAPSDVVEKFGEAVTNADADLNAALTNFNAAMEVDRKAMADKRLELSKSGAAPEIVESALSSWVEEQKSSDAFKRRAMMAAKALEDARDRKNTIIGYYTDPRYPGSFPTLLSQKRGAGDNFTAPETNTSRDIAF